MFVNKKYRYSNHIIDTRLSVIDVHWKASTRNSKDGRIIKELGKNSKL